MKTNKKIAKLKNDFRYYDDLIGKTSEPRSHLLLMPVEQLIKIILGEMEEEVGNPDVRHMQQLTKMLSRFVALKNKYFKI